MDTNNDENVIKRAIEIIKRDSDLARKLLHTWNTIKNENFMNKLNIDAFGSGTIDNKLYSTYEIFKKNFSVGDNVYCSYSYVKHECYGYNGSTETPISIFIKGKIISIGDENVVIEGSVYENGAKIQPSYKIQKYHIGLSTTRIKKF